MTTAFLPPTRGHNVLLFKRLRTAIAGRSCSWKARPRSAVIGNDGRLYCDEHFIISIVKWLIKAAQVKQSGISTGMLCIIYWRTGVKWVMYNFHHQKLRLWKTFLSLMKHVSHCHVSKEMYHFNHWLFKQSWVKRISSVKVDTSIGDNRERVKRQEVWTSM